MRKELLTRHEENLALFFRANHICQFIKTIDNEKALQEEVKLFFDAEIEVYKKKLAISKLTDFMVKDFIEQHNAKYQDLINAEPHPKIRVIVKAYLEYIATISQQINQDKPSQQEQKSFKSTLSELQKKKLHKALIKDEYIDSTTNESDFITVFGGSLPVGFNQIIWIDKSIKRHEPNVQTLFELLYLLKPYFDYNYTDTAATNESNFYRLIENCFADVKNLPEKNKYKALSDTPRKKQLKSIVDSL